MRTTEVRDIKINFETLQKGNINSYNNIPSLILSDFNKEQITELASFLEHLLLNSKCLTELAIEYSCLVDQGVKALAKHLRNNTTLKRLQLFASKIEEKGLKALAEALIPNTTLTSLNISAGLKIGLEGAKAIAELLNYNDTITELVLNGIYIGDQELTIIAESLRYNTTLNVLGLEGNDIGDKGLKDLAEALKTNTGIINLILSRNPNISLTGNQVMTNTTKDNKRIIYYNGNATDNYNGPNYKAVQIRRGIKGKKDFTKIKLNYGALEFLNKYADAIKYILLKEERISIDEAEKAFKDIRYGNRTVLFSILSKNKKYITNDGKDLSPIFGNPDIAGLIASYIPKMQKLAIKRFMNISHGIKNKDLQDQLVYLVYSLHAYLFSDQQKEELEQQANANGRSLKFTQIKENENKGTYRIM